MARYFAEIDQSDFVIRVIVSEPSYINSGRVGNPSDWVECFMDEDGVINPKNLYPGVGYNYNSSTDVFYPAHPYPSWTLDESYYWQPPTPKPEQWEYDENNIPKPWIWDEDSQSWYNE